MTPKITRDIIESYLNCKYEGHLKLVGQRGIQSDYGILLAASRDAVRRLTRRARLEYGYTVAAVAREAGVHYSTVSKVNKGGR